MEVSGQYRVLATLPPGKDPVSYRIGGWVGRINGQDVLKEREIGTPDHLVRSLVSVPTSYPGCPEGKQRIFVTLMN